MALLSLLLLAAIPPEHLFELCGKVYLPSAYRGRFVYVRLSGMDRPYLKNDTLLNKSSFRFKKLPPGFYVLAAWVRQYGLYERTVEVAPSAAGKQSCINADLRLDLNPGRPLPVGAGLFVSVRQLSIPRKAQEEFAKAYQAFAKHDEDGGIAHLEKAIAIAPQFAEALNTLGTVYYRRGDAAPAEQYFRESLIQNPRQFDAAMNLSNSLLSQQHPAEALEYIQNALKLRPQDAKALTLLGWVLLELGRVDEALTQFREAMRIAPGDISRPQLGIIAVYARRGDRAGERQELEDYLRRFPDDPEAPRVRARLRELQ